MSRVELKGPMTEVDSVLRQSLGQVRKWEGGASYGTRQGTGGCRGCGNENWGTEDKFCPVHKLAAATGQEVNKY